MSNPLIARFAGEPALVEPAHAQRFEANLNAVAAHPRGQELLSGEFATGQDFWCEDGGWCRPYTVADGILQIPIKGVLLNNFPYALYDWATGYEYIFEAFKRGCADFSIGAIKGIALICDTPGGMVAGCFDARDKMLALKDQTGVPVWGFAHESAYSAGYAMVTVADKIAVSRTGGVGSIGVVTGHLDVSGAMAQAGLKFTYIASDPSKVEGNQYEPLSPDAKARIQTRIDELYGIFVAAVTGSRGLSEDAVRNNLKAYCYTATQAVSNGLADMIGTLEDATAAFAACLDDQSEIEDGDNEMSTQDSSTVEQAVHEQAVASARNEGHASGVADTKARIGAILGSDEAKGREKQAHFFAFKTDMSAEDAVAALAEAPLAAAPVVAPAAAAPSFTEAMNASDNPSVNAGAETERPNRVAAVMAAGAALGIKGFKPQNKE